LTFSIINQVEIGISDYVAIIDISSILYKFRLVVKFNTGQLDLFLVRVAVGGLLVLLLLLGRMLT